MSDKLNVQMYVCNDVAVAYADSGNFPTVDDLRLNWNASKYKDLTDNQIQHMLNLLKRYYL